MDKRAYENFKSRLLTAPAICEANREHMRKFLAWEEQKLKRQNGIPSLDDPCYRTLYGFVGRLQNVNKWFENKDFEKITQDDIKRVYDALEDGKIKTQNGKPFKDRKSYYNKIFKSKFFQMLGKGDMAREVIEYYQPSQADPVRFIREDKFHKLQSVIIKPEHRLLTWLVWDISENVNALLQLEKKDCRAEVNPDTSEREYHIVLDAKILKRSRKARTEITNHQETVELLDIVLKQRKEDERVFPFEYRAAKKFIDRAVRITGAVCEPKGQPVTWKDLRSSCACDLLLKGWTTDEVNARLGHRPSSAEIDKYINFLALDRHKGKKKIVEHSLAKLNDELKQTRDTAKLEAKRRERLEEELEKMKAQLRLVAQHQRITKEQIAKAKQSRK